MSIAGGVDRAIDRARAARCTTLQIFVKNNMQWFAKPLPPAEIANFERRRAEAGIDPIFSHAGYLINLGATHAGTFGKSLRSLADELRRAEALRLSCVVMHPGSHLGRGEEAGMRQIARAIDQVFAEVGWHRRANGKRPRLALEVTAGQGSNLGYRFEHLARIVELVRQPDRLAVCLDTCHLFAAGYDIRNAKGYAATMRELDRRIGIDRVLAIHLNDSKTPLGSRVDRHDHIGKGHIGSGAFRLVLNDPRFRRVPKVLETPKGPEINGVGEFDKLNLARLRRLSLRG